MPRRLSVRGRRNPPRGHRRQRQTLPPAGKISRREVLAKSDENCPAQRRRKANLVIWITTKEREREIEVGTSARETLLIVESEMCKNNNRVEIHV